MSSKWTTGGRARRAVLLAGPPLLRPEGAESWLVNLRWTAIIGMLATIMVAKQYVPDLRLLPLLVTLGLVVVTNLVWWRVVRRRSSEKRRTMVIADG